MATLQPATTAPEFTRTSRSRVDFRVPVRDGLTLLLFYKVTCPTCRLAAPYVSRFRAYEKRGPFTVVAVAQDTDAAAKDFEREYELGLESLSEGPPYPASTDYGLTNVPTVFLISEDGIILHTEVGFSKAGYNAISDAIAARLGGDALLIAPPDDGTPEMKPG